MLRYALLFLVVSLIAAAFGFWVAAGIIGMIAKALFLIFLILFIVALAVGRRGPSRSRR